MTPIEWKNLKKTGALSISLITAYQCAILSSDLMIFYMGRSRYEAYSGLSIVIGAVAGCAGYMLIGYAPKVHDSICKYCFGLNQKASFATEQFKADLWVGLVGFVYVPIWFVNILSPIPSFIASATCTPTAVLSVKGAEYLHNKCCFSAVSSALQASEPALLKSEIDSTAIELIPPRSVGAMSGAKLGEGIV